MTRLQQYWSRVRGLQAELTAERGRFCHIVSLEGTTPAGKAGVVIETSADLAAECIVRETHRLV